VVGFPLIIDGNSLVKRCIMASALDDLKAGEIWTGGVYGTLSMLTSYLAPIDGQAGPIIAFFDSGKPESKLTLLPSYKADRAQKKALLSPEQHAKAMSQMEYAREMLELLGVLVLAYKNREADDGVAAAVKCAKSLGWQEPVVMTGDRDLWQCVQSARIWDLNKKRYITRDNFEEVTGLSWRAWTIYKALVGDPSDSIAGVNGCGEKRAKGLIEEAIEEDDTFLSVTPEAQLERLVEHLHAKKKRKKYEQALLDGDEYIRLVLKVITVWNHFGGTKGLRKKLTGPWPKVQKLPFLRFCKRLKFGSVLGNPDRFLRPFLSAQARRDRA
jgi:5'-3' exonuclease